ncbi:putative glycine cleavage system H protein 2 [Clarias magur]|uniref:Putative glycine cleavage system H protein 2 n=1 Tax=Clarias magur TaxID=1594786 RepID=A0A8J4U1A4_CLAMG|nr:putative glycine cleavage system H protein 2 [Clarias magur]
MRGPFNGAPGEVESQASVSNVLHLTHLESTHLPPHPLNPFTAFLPLSASEDPRGKRWLSPYLINDPSESCPAALGLHVSRLIRKSGPRAFVLGGNGVSGPLCR